MFRSEVRLSNFLYFRLGPFGLVPMRIRFLLSTSKFVDDRLILNLVWFFWLIDIVVFWVRKGVTAFAFPLLFALIYFFFSHYRSRLCFFFHYLFPDLVSLANQIYYLLEYFLFCPYQCRSEPTVISIGCWCWCLYLIGFHQIFDERSYIRISPVLTH